MIVRKTLFALALVAGFVACQSEEESVPIDEGSEESESVSAVGSEVTSFAHMDDLPGCNTCERLRHRATRHCSAMGMHRGLYSYRCLHQQCARYSAILFNCN
jgi:Zn-dependent alcohol dehydrogenase